MSAALAAPRAVEHAAVPEANGGVISYASPRIDVMAFPTDAAYSNGLLLACTSAIFGLFALAFYSHSFAEMHRVNALALRSAPYRRWSPTAGAGYALRLVSDVSGAVLQAGRIWVDYAILSVGEVSWVALAFYFPFDRDVSFNIEHVGRAYAFSGVAVMGMRWVFGGTATGQAAAGGD